MELKELVLDCRNVDDIYTIFKIYFKVNKKVARKPITEKKLQKTKDIVMVQCKEYHGFINECDVKNDWVKVIVNGFLELGVIRWLKFLFYLW